LVEFTGKKASSEKIMVAERRAMRELEEKESADTGNAAWQAYWLTDAHTLMSPPVW
jgi:hypothetical protein